MIHLRILQQSHGTYAGERILTDNRFDVVVEVDYVGFPEA
jgi:hypothetical protein